MEACAGRVPRLLAIGLVMLCAAAPARAQHGLVPPEDRPLHERLAAAPVVAIATVKRIDAGRVLAEDAAPLLGTVATSFELKRAPSRPPPWKEGDRVLLLLSGARSPYRWVDRPVEALAPLADAEAERRWSSAIRELAGLRSDPAARRDLYARWCDAGPEDLRAAGLRGLLDLPGMVGVLDERFALERAAVASDVARPLAVRRPAALVATRHPAGIEALLAHLGEAGAASDAELADIVLQAGLRTRSPAAEARLVELLPVAEGALREVVLRLASYALGLEVEHQLSELAVGHPEARVRADATEALKRLRRNRQTRGQL
jgi:hypothetical protein